MENSIEIPEKLKIELLYDPETPLLGTYLKKIKYGRKFYFNRNSPANKMKKTYRIRLFCNL